MVPPRIGVARSPVTVAGLYVLLVLVACGVTFHSLALSMRAGDDMVTHQQKAAVDRGLTAFLHRLALEMRFAGLGEEIFEEARFGAADGVGCKIAALERLGHKICFLVDEAGQPLRSAAEPRAQPPEQALQFARRASRIIGDLAARPPFHRNEYRHLARGGQGADVYHRHIVELTTWNGAPAFAVASTVFPEVRSPPRKGQPHIVIAIAEFGDELLERLGAEIGLSAMRWVKQNAAGTRAVLNVRNGAGADIGIVGWRESRLTPRIIKSTRNQLVGAAILMVVLSLLVIVLAGNYLGQMREHRARIQHYAEHDQLTGLGNRFLFNRRIKEELATIAGRGSKLSLLSFDLDRLKDVNDRFGHPAGDATLVEVARRMREVCPPGADLLRLGGDEIVVLLPATEPPVALGIAERMIASIVQPIDLVDGLQARVGASAGLVVLPDDAGDAVEALLRADLALYQAKRSGGNKALRFGIELAREAAGHSGPGAQRAVAGEGRRQLRAGNLG